MKSLKVQLLIVSIILCSALSANAAWYSETTSITSIEQRTSGSKIFFMNNGKAQYKVIDGTDEQHSRMLATALTAFSLESSVKVLIDGDNALGIKLVK